MYNFNPPSPCGEGQQQPALPPLRPYFNPPSPCGEGHDALCLIIDFSTISIHPPRAGRDHIKPVEDWAIEISIHPPRAGRDQLPRDLPESRVDFNPPSPCGEGHVPRKERHQLDKISIHPPRAGRDGVEHPHGQRLQISIHPPRAGRDALSVAFVI